MLYRLVFFAPLCVACAFPQARSIFIDTTTNNTVGSKGDAKPAGNVKAKPHGPETTPAGLKYYLDLEKPGGEIEQVTTSRVFHNGERVRLHFTTNMDGYVYILQRSPNGGSQALFPNAQLGVTDNFAHAGQDMTLPSKRSWFTFDDHAGEERLMVFVTPLRVDQIERLALGSANVDATETATLARSIPPRGTRSLMIEVDDKSEQKAEYAVNKTGSLALEIVMQHR